MAPHRAPFRPLLWTGLCFVVACGQPFPEGAQEDEAAGIIAESPVDPAEFQTTAQTQEERKVLDLINQARRTARTCGTKAYVAAPALRADDRLDRAARGHSTDMATKNFFSHTGSDGSQPWDRMTRQGYAWSAAGENIAAGYGTPDAAVQGWLKSAGHCANLMNARFTQTGVGRATGGRYGIYWTQVFGRPR